MMFKLCFYIDSRLQDNFAREIAFLERVLARLKSGGAALTPEQLTARAARWGMHPTPGIMRNTGEMVQPAHCLTVRPRSRHPKALPRVSMSMSGCFSSVSQAGPI